MSESKIQQPSNLESSAGSPEASESGKRQPRTERKAEGQKIATESLAGKRFGFLLVIEKDGKGPGGDTMYRCLCDCGKYTRTIHNRLSSGMTKSCGCLRTKTCISLRTKHGCAGANKQTTEYKAWANIIARCENSNNKSFKDYGGRGIKICERWRKSFQHFLSDMGSRPNGTSIDRIDNNGDYEPGNCRWATRQQQASNKRGVIPITINGETKLPPEWAEIYNVPTHRIYCRISHGWDPVKAVTTPKLK